MSYFSEEISVKNTVFEKKVIPSQTISQQFQKFSKDSQKLVDSVFIIVAPGFTPDYHVIFRVI